VLEEQGEAHSYDAQECTFPVCSLLLHKVGLGQHCIQLQDGQLLSLLTPGSHHLQHTSLACSPTSLMELHKWSMQHSCLPTQHSLLLSLLALGCQQPAKHRFSSKSYDSLCWFLYDDLTEVLWGSSACSCSRLSRLRPQQAPVRSPKGVDFSSFYSPAGWPLCMPMLRCDVKCMYDITRRSFMTDQWQGAELADTQTVRSQAG